MSKRLLLGLAALCVSAFAQPVRFDGLYQTPETGGSVHCLRFYADGVVMDVTVSKPAPVKQIMGWFHRDNRDISKGSYRVTGRNISFTTTGIGGGRPAPVVVDYEGTLDGDTMTLSIHSHRTGYRARKTYRFAPEPSETQKVQ